MISNYRPNRSGWAILLLSAATLALAGCGRKAGLDLPPNTPPQAAAAAQADADHEPGPKASVFDPTYGTDAAPKAPKGGKKFFILDPLLDSH